MRTVYRVTVAAIICDDDGIVATEDVLFEATHHRPEALLRFAPGEVEVVLEEVALAGVPQRVVQGLPSVPDWDRATSAAPVDGAAVPQQAGANVATAAPKATRKRRTKAEIAADRAREAAGGNAFGEQVVADTEAATEALPAEAGPAAAPPAAPVAVPEPVPAEVGATPASTPGGAAETPPAVPWNPFQQR